MSTPLSEQTRWLGKRDGRPGTDVTCLGFGAATISNHHDAYQMSEAQAIDAVIFGCTEVGLLLNQSSIDQAGFDLPAFDTTAIHCRAAAAAMLTSPGD